MFGVRKLIGLKEEASGYLSLVPFPVIRQSGLVLVRVRWQKKKSPDPGLPARTHTPLPCLLGLWVFLGDQLKIRQLLAYAGLQDKGTEDREA